MVLFKFSNLLLLGKLLDFDETVVFLFVPKQCTEIPVQKLTLSHAHKHLISDVIRHKSIFA